jgi:hypothetical protein
MKGLERYKFRPPDIAVHFPEISQVSGGDAAECVNGLFELFEVACVLIV